MRRRWWQLVAAAVTNGWLPGYWRGTIYQGPIKTVCLPILNCYSCPGALTACPIGSFQSVAVSTGCVSLYIAGLLMAVGALVGRAACAWACPFGLIQDLLARIPAPRLKLSRPLTRLPYVILVLTVLLPFAWFQPSTGLSSPYFCKYLCPAGTLEAGLPLGAMNPAIRDLMGGMFLWKVLVLMTVLVAMVLVPRFFCRVLCPLGAFLGLFNRASCWHLRLEAGGCTDCGACSAACGVDLDPSSQPNDERCIRCLACRDACPTGALLAEWALPFPGKGEAATERGAAGGV